MARRKAAPLVWADGIPAIIKLGAPFVLGLLWLQNNFATTKMYLDQQSEIMQINQKIDAKHLEVKELIDQRHREDIVHSDENRERVMAVITEIKDSLKTLYFSQSGKH